MGAAPWRAPGCRPGKGILVRVTPLAIDAEVLGYPALALEDLSADDDLAAAEAAYCRTYRPGYVSCKLPIARVAEIHALERLGFRFIECQLTTELRLRRPVPVAALPYRFERVTDAAALDAVLEIAGETFECDRFRLDPALPPGISGARYRRFVRQSFEVADEAVYRLYDPESGRTLAFKTHRLTGPDRALLLLGGVHPAMKQAGLGPLNSYLELNLLFAQGIRHITSHLSAMNLPIVNVEVRKMGYHVVETDVVLRKIYPV